jgi:phosphate transport system substrate-binding protein
MIKKALCLLAVAGLLAGSQPVLAGTTIVIKGSTTVLPIAQATAEAYMKLHPGVNISLSGGGSGDGVKALIDGSCNGANSSRDLKPEEIELAKSRGVNPVTHTLAVDAIAPIVNPKNPVQNLTIEQLSLIYQGKITNWKEVGGNDLQIVAVSRDTSSGTYETWEKFVLHGAKVTPKAQLQASNGAIVQTVSKNKYAIGYIGLGYLNKSVKGLSVNAITASAATAASGKYSLSRPLFMFTNGKPTGELAKYITFILSPQGQKIVAKEGFVPLTKK